MLIPRDKNNLMSLFKSFIPYKIDKKTFGFSSGFFSGNLVSEKKLTIKDFKSGDLKNTIYLVKEGQVFSFIYQDDLEKKIKSLEKEAKNPLSFIVIRRENIQVIDTNIYAGGNLISIAISREKAPNENKFKFKSWYYFFDKVNFTGKKPKEGWAKEKYFNLDGEGDIVCLIQKLTEKPYEIPKDVTIKIYFIFLGLVDF